MADVSVIVPTHNRRSLLRRTLRSILRQRGVDFEVIVVDDGSVDDTPEAVLSVGDPRLRLVRHEVARGLSAARNRGIGEALSEWVAFCDDDDLWAADKLAHQLEAAAGADRFWAYAGVVYIDDNLNVLGGSPPPEPPEVVRMLPRLCAVPAGGSNVLVRRESLVAAGPFDERMPACEDWDMWIRLSEVGPPGWVSAPLVAYRVHPDNMSIDSARVLAGVALLEQRHGNSVDHGALRLDLAESSLRAGRRGKALLHFVLAAARGRSTEVLGYLAATARRRLDKVVRGGPSQWTEQTSGRRHPDWAAAAMSWLEELRVVNADEPPSDPSVSSGTGHS